jgi:PAS domain S-box-containing protein
MLNKIYTYVGSPPKPSAKPMFLKAEALQNAIFNSANFSSIATDVNGVIQIFNVGAENMLGYFAVEVMNTLTPADLSDASELILRADALSLELGTVIMPGFEALVFKAARGIEDIYELTYIRKDGSRFPAVVSVTALRDDDETIIGYLLIGTDNTARKHAEQALRKAGALQSAIFNSANFSSIATDVNGVIQIFNVGAENMLGYSAVEVMNTMTPADLSDAEELILRADALSLEFQTVITPGFDALVFKASRGIEDIYELTYIRKDGSRFPAVVSVTALRDDDETIIGYLLIGTDNSARKLAEESMRIAAVAFETAQGMFITDANGLFVRANQAFSEMTGYTMKDIAGKNPSIMKSGIQGPAFYAEMWRSINVDGKWSGEIWNRKKNGELYLELLSIVKVSNDRGCTTHYVATFADITKQKDYEAGLITAKERAERFLQLKSQFVASMSHEIRTPMSAIIGFSQLALVNTSPDKARLYLENINTASTSLLGILNDILDFSKLEAGRIVIDAIPFRLTELLHTIEATLGGAATQKRLALTIEHDGSIPSELIGDKLRLQQVLINLLGNAIKFTEQGTINLKITLEQINLTQACLLFCVSDTGIGIATDDQEKLFQAFSQVDGSITRKYGGTGLGLAISKELLELMGSEFSIDSVVGEGSSFSFVLQLGISRSIILSGSNAFLPKPVLPQFLLRSSLNGFSVLVAEDNLLIQQIVQAFLTPSGIKVKIANNGEEALAMLEQDDFDAVLMDIHMPVMNGITATELIRQQVKFAQLPIIALTAGVTVGEREKCEACGMNGFIGKPIDQEQLFSILEQWVKPSLN